MNILFKSCTVLLFLVVTLTSGNAQDSTAVFYSNFIQPTIIKKHLSVLASDSLEGRETATQGMIKAANYVAAVFNELGIPPCNNNSYFQNIPLIKEWPAKMKIAMNEKQFSHGYDFFSIDGPPFLDATISNIVFAGYGIIDSASGWNDYKNMDVKGKLVILMDGEPNSKKNSSLISGNKESSKWKNDRSTKVNIAVEKNAAAVFVIHNDFQNTYERMNKRLAAGRLVLNNDKAKNSIPVAYITEKMAEELLKNSSVSIEDWKKKPGKYKKSNPSEMMGKVQINCVSDAVSCNNVLGYIEGTSKKDELIIITAHLDHLGKRNDKIYYGADDDGSGSASVLNIAEAFMKAKKDGKGPKRSVLVMMFSGEEKGLLGSEHYTSNPVFPLENTVVDLNIDMIGRVDTVKRDTPYYTYIIGSDKLSTSLHQINETSNKFCCKLELDYKYNDPSDKLRLYYRSDHYNFAKNNIPVIFYFTGLHEDYHKTTDTIDKIDFDKTARIARLVFNTAWELANREERIKVDVKNDFK